MSPSIEESYEMPKHSLFWMRCFNYCDKISRNCVVVDSRRVKPPHAVQVWFPVSICDTTLAVHPMLVVCFFPVASTQDTRSFIGMVVKVLSMNEWGMASCDQDHWSKLLFPHPIKAPYEIWLWFAQWFLRRRCLKSVDEDGRRRWTTEAYLSY